MIEKQIKILNELREQLKKDSCIAKEPFMKLGEGDAPSLNYNLPQSSSFSTYGDVSINLDKGMFKKECFEVPKQNYFEQIERTDPEDLRQNFSEAIQLQSDSSPFLLNIKLLHRNLDFKKTNFEAIALSEIRKLKEKGEVKGAQDLRTAHIFQKDTFLNERQLVKIAQKGLMPVVTEKFGGFGTKVNTIKPPVKPNPRIYVIEEYKTASFLGNYGAGKTVQTFSLLPGEKQRLRLRLIKIQLLHKEERKMF